MTKYTIQNLINHPMVERDTLKPTRLWYLFLLHLFNTGGSGQAPFDLGDFEALIESLPTPNTSRLDLAQAALEAERATSRTLQGQINRLERRLINLESQLFAMNNSKNVDDIRRSVDDLRGVVFGGRR